MPEEAPARFVPCEKCGYHRRETDTVCQNCGRETETAVLSPPGSCRRAFLRAALATGAGSALIVSLYWKQIANLFKRSTASVSVYGTVSATSMANESDYTGMDGSSYNPNIPSSYLSGPPDPDLEYARELHRLRHYPSAVTVYKRILTEKPQHPQANWIRTLLNDAENRVPLR